MLKYTNAKIKSFRLAGHMVPLSAETGGRFDGAFSHFLKEVVTSGLPGFRLLEFKSKHRQVDFIVGEN